MNARIKSGAVSTILEFYDFTIYVYLSTYIAPLFFPHKNSVTSSLLFYSIFAIGFFIRPIGAYIYGGFGDKFGRKRTLLLTFVSMVCATFLIGLLPTFKEIGYFSPVLLVLLRLIQGFSAGGEVAGSATFVMEGNIKRKYISGALVWAGSGVGILFGSLIVTLITLVFTKNEILSFAWRIPFLLSLLTGAIGFYIRVKTTESPEFIVAKENSLLEINPWKKLFLTHKAKVLKVIFLYALCAVTTYLLFVFMPVYAIKHCHISTHLAMISNTISMIVMMCLVVLVGALADRYGARRFMFTGALLAFIAAYPLYELILLGGFAYLFIGQIFFAVITALYQGPVTGFSFFQTRVSMRYSVTALGYNISYSIFGGLTPFIATYVGSLFRMPATVAFYLMFCAAISLIGISLLKSPLKQHAH